MRSLLAVPLAVLAAAAASAQAQVHVVAPVPGPGVDFVTLQAAVDAAVTGDVILVRPGTYSAGCTMVAKAVHLVADDPTGVGGRPLVHAPKPVELVTTPGGWTTVVRGLDLRGTWDGFGNHASALTATSCGGAVLVEDCTLAVDDGPGMPYPVAAASLHQCMTGVAFRATSATGADGFDWLASPSASPAVGQPGVYAFDTRVQAFDCAFTGGDGGDGNPVCSGAPCSAGARGGDAIALLGGTCSLHAAALAGGAGGAGANVGPDGGDGVGGSGATVVFQEVGFVPGTGGAGTSGPGADGVLAAPGIVSVSSLPAPARTYSIDAPGRVGHAVTARFAGAPGDLAFLFAGRSLGLVSIFAEQLPLALAFPAVHLTLVNATVPASGVVDVPVGLPSIGGEEVRWSFGQALFVTTAGLQLSSVSAAVVLDPSF